MFTPLKFASNFTFLPLKIMHKFNLTKDPHPFPSSFLHGNGRENEVEERGEGKNGNNKFI